MNYDLWNIGDSEHILRKASDDKNKYNETVFSDPISIKATCYGSEEYRRDAEAETLGYSLVYQTTENITKGDMIDDRLVVKVTPCKNIFGEFEFNVCYVS